MNYFAVASLAGMVLMIVVISYYDIRTHLIKDSNTLALLGYVGFYKYLVEEVFDFCNGLLLALAVNLTVFYLVKWFYGSEEYGLGDVFLHGCVGGFFGPAAYFNFFLFSVMLMGLAVLLLLVFRIISRNTAIPLAPVIFSSAVCFYCLGRPDFLKMMGFW